MSLHLRMVARTALAMVAIVWVCASPSLGEAQELRGVVAGEVREANATEGIAGVFLLTLNAQDQVIGRGMSGSGGYFAIELPVGGPYRLRAQSMGVRDIVTDTFRIVPGDTVWMSNLELIPDAASGIGSRENAPDQDARIRGISEVAASVIRATAIRFIHIPAFTIWGMVR